MIGISVFEGYFPPFHSNCYPHQVTSQPGPCLPAPLPSLFDQTNYSGQKQAELVYSEQPPEGGQLGPANNMIYHHQICAITTNPAVYPANINTEAGQF